MLATRTVAGLDMFRPPVVRVHEMPVSSTSLRPLYAPALSFPQQVTVQQAIDALRQMQTENDCIYYLFVTDYEEHLVGVVSLRQLIIAPPGARLFELMDRRTITLPPDASLAQQARLMRETGLMALPVVDEDGRLVGAVDTHELIAAVKDETTEEMYHLNGVGKNEEIDGGVLENATGRISWLLFNMVSVFLLAWIVSLFSDTITQMAILAAFIPVVAGQGRNASMQTLTFFLRSLMLGKINRTNVRKVAGRELAIGVTNGLLIGGLVGIAGWFWQGNIALGLIAGLATWGAMLIAPIAGVLVPFLLKSCHLNPSKGATLLVTTVVHSSALLLFLGLGSIMSSMGYL
jgi:magnesium transporter